jgi:hypothetical protein
VRLNRAIAVAELDGPEVALAEIDGLPLEGYHAFHATRADLLRRLGRSEESRAAYDRAIGLAGNTAETAYLIRRRDQLDEEYFLSRSFGSERSSTRSTPEPLPDRCRRPARRDTASRWSRRLPQNAGGLPSPRV